MSSYTCVNYRSTWINTRLCHAIVAREEILELGFVYHILIKYKKIHLAFWENRKPLISIKKWHKSSILPKTSKFAFNIPSYYVISSKATFSCLIKATLQIIVAALLNNYHKITDFAHLGGVYLGICFIYLGSDVIKCI